MGSSGGDRSPTQAAASGATTDPPDPAVPAPASQTTAWPVDKPRDVDGETPATNTTARPWMLYDQRTLDHESIRKGITRSFKNQTRNSNAMFKMPELRHAQLRASARGLDFQRPTNAEATLIQTMGTVCKPACKSCQKESGPFEGCYTVTGVAAGACGNCHYNSESKRCTFHKSNQPAEPESTPDTATKGKKRKAESAKEPETRTKSRKSKKSITFAEVTGPNDASPPSSGRSHQGLEPGQGGEQPVVLRTTPVINPVPKFDYAAAASASGDKGMLAYAPGYGAAVTTGFQQLAPAYQPPNNPYAAAFVQGAQPPASGAGNTIEIPIYGGTTEFEARRMARMFRDIANKYEDLADNLADKRR